MKLLKKKITKISKFIDKYNYENGIIIISKQTENKIRYNFYLYTNEDLFEVKEIYNYEYNYIKLFNDLKIETIDKWKIINRIQNTNINNINCSIAYFNLMELKQIKFYLKNTSVINKLKLKRITLNKNYYDIEFYGHLNLLPNLLNINGLNIKIHDEDCKIYLK